MRDDGWRTVRTGVTTVAEVVRVTQEDGGVGGGLARSAAPRGREGRRARLAEPPAAAARRVAVIGLDGVGLPLVQDLIARGIMPTLARLAAARHDGADALVDPDHLERVVDRLHDREEPRASTASTASPI